ncbi:hypothetical protein BDDG_00393 [Blastomyces dermatitidis ATCC 18188]|uniref:Uncharacterized protein n=1 Tax=Ajellomyces dermatitidis (strain ATCC 18188 / CBS 674.68) TaxID=653446 RepID=F2T1X2_AJEDA|nr:hypothetical protein BDDG_00393 [Blastomyces dermatitidis ATCC 18188]
MAHTHPTRLSLRMHEMKMALLLVTPDHREDVRNARGCMLQGYYMYLGEATLLCKARQRSPEKLDAEQWTPDVNKSRRHGAILAWAHGPVILSGSHHLDGCAS